MTQVNFCFQSTPSEILVQFHDEGHGVDSEKAIGIIVTRKSDNKYIGSTAMDAHVAAFVPLMLLMGTNILLALRRDGEEVGQFQLIKGDEGDFFVHIKLPEVVDCWRLTGEDFSDISALFLGEVVQ